MAITAHQLHQLYLAYLGRPADQRGLAFYAALTDADLTSTAAAFSESAESAEIYGNDSEEARIHAIYRTLFNREAEPDGLAYWLGEINSGRLTPALAAFAILIGAQNQDATAVANKLEVVRAFVESLDTAQKVEGYSGAEAAASARLFLQSVSNQANSMETALQMVDAAVAHAIEAGAGPRPGPDELAMLDPSDPGAGREPAVPSSTGPAFPQAQFAFTTGADDLSGTGQDDIFMGQIGGIGATIQAGDKANGLAGLDTLNLMVASLAENRIPRFSTNAIETITVRNRSGEMQTVDATMFAGATLFTSDNSSNTLVFDNMAQGQAGGTLRDGMSTGAGLYFRYAEAATQAELRLSQSVNDSVAIGGGGIRGTTILSVAGGNGNSLAQLRVVGKQNSQIEIQANDSIRIDRVRAEATDAEVVVKGSGANVALGSLDGIVEVDASSFSGAVEMHGGSAATFVNGFRFSGGSGNDIYHIRGFVTSGSVDAGAGVDVLAVHESEHLTAASAAFYSGFESLQVHDGVTADASLLGELTTITLVDGDNAAGTRVVGLGAAASITVLEANGDQGEIGLEGSFGIALLLPGAAGSELTLGAIDAPTLTELRIDAARDYSIELSSMPHLAGLEASGSGNAHVVAGEVQLSDGNPHNGGIPFDFSAVTGDVIFDASGLVTFIYTVTGSLEGRNAFFRSHAAQEEFFDGGNRNDHLTVEGGQGNVRADLGSGGDVIDVRFGEGFAGGYVFVEINGVGDSRVNPQATGASNAFDENLCDTLMGLANERAFVDEEDGTGSQAFFRMQGAANLTQAPGFDDAVTFGTTAVERFGFFILDYSGVQAGTAYVFQDSNGTSTVDQGDVMVRLVGAEAFTSDEFRIGADGQTLVYRSQE